MFRYSRDRTAGPQRHLAGYAGILQADAYARFNDRYAPGRKPGPINAAEEVVHADASHLRIVDDALWEKAQQRIEASAPRKDPENG